MTEAQQAAVEHYLDQYFGDYVWVGPPEEYWKTRWLSGETRQATAVCVNNLDPCRPQLAGAGKAHYENWMLATGNPFSGIRDLSKKKTKKLAAHISFSHKTEKADSETPAAKADKKESPESCPQPVHPKQRWMLKARKDFEQAYFKPLESNREIPEIIVKLMNVLVSALNHEPPGFRSSKCRKVKDRLPHLFLLNVAAIHYYLTLGVNNEAGAESLHAYIKAEELSFLRNDAAIASLERYSELPEPVVPDAGTEDNYLLFDTNWQRICDLLGELSQKKTAPEESFPRALGRFALVLYFDSSIGIERRKQLVMFLDEYCQMKSWRSLIQWPEAPKPEPAELKSPESVSQEEAKPVLPPQLPIWHPIGTEPSLFYGLLTERSTSMTRHYKHSIPAVSGMFPTPSIAGMNGVEQLAPPGGYPRLSESAFSSLRHDSLPLRHPLPETTTIRSGCEAEKTISIYYQRLQVELAG